MVWLVGVLLSWSACWCSVGFVNEPYHLSINRYQFFVRIVGIQFQYYAGRGGVVSYCGVGVWLEDFL